jgi:hypothetical protein
MPCNRAVRDQYANELQMAGQRHTTSLRRLLTGSALLVVFLLLNAAVVVPAFHALWHGDHDCDETECVVLAVAQGNFENPEADMPLGRSVEWVRVAEILPPASPLIPHVGPPPAERAPPV